MHMEKHPISKIASIIESEILDDAQLNELEAGDSCEQSCKKSCSPGNQNSNIGNGSGNGNGVGNGASTIQKDLQQQISTDLIMNR